MGTEELKKLTQRYRRQEAALNETRQEVWKEINRLLDTEEATPTEVAEDGPFRDTYIRRHRRDRKKAAQEAPEGT
ncbi:hypothetical protein NE857_09380 [Nocardiopsis exhalans]|uniref:Uncharacterized protein n=1 Tax=Nocardiopsis exhalans TaxID=163604 RepID=A0ABY5DFE9_9ACTN|nr:hypothetical protein [Nocardiopsis exhalans]USY21793.1 hypothetical protein NE857_09380 [Nocardiopsis exhalans]